MTRYNWNRAHCIINRALRSNAVWHCPINLKRGITAETVKATGRKLCEVCRCRVIRTVVPDKYQPVVAGFRLFRFCLGLERNVATSCPYITALWNWVDEHVEGRICSDLMLHVSCIYFISTALTANSNFYHSAGRRRVEHRNLLQNLYRCIYNIYTLVKFRIIW